MMLRRLQHEDIPSAARVLSRSWQSAYRPELGQELLSAANESYFTRLLSHHFDASSKNTFVALDEEDQILGYLSLEGPEIKELYVDPAHFGQGVGRTLLALGVEEIREHGEHEPYLWVSKLNQGAQSFYSTCGFLPSDESRVVDVFDRQIEMVKWLPAFP